MKKQFSTSMFFVIVLTLCFVACASDAVRSAEKPVAKTVDASVPRNVAATTSLTPNMSARPGCDGLAALTFTDRNDVLNKTVLNAETEVLNNPNVLTDRDARARAGLFAAATLDDSVEFVTLDRDCWVRFYEGHAAIVAKDEEAAATAGKAWEACVRALFPQRLPLAEPYFSCFAKPGTRLKN